MTDLSHHHRRHQIQSTTNQMNLLKVLLISWLTGIGLSYSKYVIFEYQYIRVIMSLCFYISAVFCYRYILKEVKLRRGIDLYFMCALCLCLIVSSWFNFLFVWPEAYYLLVDLKRGDGFSWKNIYKTIEILSFLVVLKNGFAYIHNWCICRFRRFNAIIANNQTYNIGRNN